jgi:hypothetical protein
VPRSGSVSRAGQFREEVGTGVQAHEIVPESGICTITHDPMQADMPREITLIKGRRFPTCRHCKGTKFHLAHSAKHVSKIDHFEEAHAPA